MNKKELIHKLADTTGFTQKDCRVFVDAFCDVVGDALKDGERVKIEGFGAFDVRTLKGRVGADFINNSRMMIPDKQVPYFTPGIFLRQIVGDDSACN